MSEIDKPDPPKTDPKPKPKPVVDETEPSNIEKYNEAKKKEEKKAKVEVDKAKDEKIDALLTEAIEARKAHAPQYVLNLIETLDPESQLEVLKAHDQRKSDPNTSTVGVPIGKDKDPLEEYMVYNPNKDTLSYSIPASVLMNSKNNKKLLGIE